MIDARKSRLAIAVHVSTLSNEFHAEWVFNWKAQRRIFRPLFASDFWYVQKRRVSTTTIERENVLFTCACSLFYSYLACAIISLLLYLPGNFSDSLAFAVRCIIAIIVSFINYILALCATAYDGISYNNAPSKLFTRPINSSCSLALPRKIGRD